MRIELVSVPADYGRGANDGAYYPVGLLTIGTHLRTMPSLEDVAVVDLHHIRDYRPRGDVVGISASSALNYRGVLAVAQAAKAQGATVVLGGPHATKLADQILRNRAGLVDYVVRGNGELAFAALLAAIEQGLGLAGVPSLSWRDGEKTLHNAGRPRGWSYDDFLPLDFDLIRGGLLPYWQTFRARLDPAVDAAFLVFTHFGCGYREAMLARHGRPEGNWCSYCSLDDPVSRRSGSAIVSEALRLVRATEVPHGSSVLLKCYGDNVGAQMDTLLDLRSAIQRSDAWSDYRFHWTFYSQSSRLSRELAECLRAVGTKSVYIGFDSADDRIQRLNGLGTCLRGHRQAVQHCIDLDLKIQAGFVLGCAGETRESLDNTLKLAEELGRSTVLDRINSAVLFIVPGAPAYNLLCAREPWIMELDDLPVEEMQWLWVKHFCPDLGRSPLEGLELLRRYANRLDDLSPGVHASMGFVSDRLAQETCTLA